MGLAFKKMCRNGFSGSGALLLLVLAGCAGSGSGGSSGGGGTQTGSGNALATGGASTVYVMQQNPNQYATSNYTTVLSYPAGGNGALTPTTTLTPPSTFIGICVGSDSSGQLYLGGYDNYAGDEILVYAAGASGSATPVRTINMSGYAGDPTGITVDSSGLLYVATDNDQLLVYSATASGAATATQTIAGYLANASQTVPYEIAVDASGNIYVSTATASGGLIAEFAKGATGNATPTRTITVSGYAFYGLAFDSSGNLYASESSFTGANAAYIAEFSATASGAATPTKTITVAAPTGNVLIVADIRLDKVNNIYAVVAQAASISATTANYSVAAYGPSSSGTGAAADQFTSTSLSNAAPSLAIR
jgi:hypothetical protein